MNNSQNSNLKEKLKIDPIQSEKMKKHLKKKSKSPQKKSLKPKSDMFTKNKTVFLDEALKSKDEPNIENSPKIPETLKNKPPEKISESKSQEITINNNIPSSIPAKEDQTSLEKPKSKSPGQLKSNLKGKALDSNAETDEKDKNDLKLNSKIIEKIESPINNEIYLDLEKKPDCSSLQNPENEHKTGENSKNPDQISFLPKKNEKKQKKPSTKEKTPKEIQKKPAKKSKIKEEKENPKALEKANKKPKKLKKTKILLNHEEYDIVDNLNIQKSHKHFTYIKACYTFWTIPVLILTLLDCQTYYKDALFCPEVTKYAKLKVLAFLAMVGIVSLLVLDMLIHCYLKGKSSKILTVTIFTINYILSIVIMISYMTFYVWKLWGSKVEFYCKIYIEMGIIFLIFAIISIRSFKLQCFVAFALAIYTLALLIYFKYYQTFVINDVMTLIGLCEVLCFLILSSIFNKFDSFEKFKGVFQEEENTNEVNMKPLTSILIDKKPEEEFTHTVIEMEKNLDKKIELKKNQSLLSISESPETGESKKWLKIFTNFQNGVLILDKNFQILYTNRKINKFLGLADNEKNSCFLQSSFESFLPLEKIPITNIEIPEILSGFIINNENEILLKKICQKSIQTIDIKEFFSDMKFLINEGLCSKNSMFFQTMKQQQISVRYELEKKLFEFSFYSFDLKAEEKDYLAFFFKEIDGEKLIIKDNMIKNPIINDNNRSSSEIRNGILLNIGSELRQSIYNIVESLEKLKENYFKNSNFNEFLDPAYHHSYLIFIFINGILDISKLNLGTFKLKLMEYDLKILIDHIITILKPQALKKNLELSYRFSKKTPKLIFTDPLRLMQIVTNLFKNSLKFTEKGFIKLNISAEMVDSELLFIFEFSDSSFVNYSEAGFETFDLKESYSLNFEMILTKRLIQELGVPGKNNLFITSRIPIGNTYKFMISSKRHENSVICDYFENLEDGPLELNYIEKKNKNIEIFKENMISDSFNCSKSSISVQTNKTIKEGFYSFPLFDTALNKYYCYCPTILLVFSDIFNIMLLQNILLKIGFTSDFCADFRTASQKIKNRISIQNCGKNCLKYEVLMVDMELENEKIYVEKTLVIGFYTNEAKAKENYKKRGINVILNKEFNQEEISDLISKGL